LIGGDSGDDGRNRSAASKEQQAALALRTQRNSYHSAYSLSHSSARLSGNTCGPVSSAAKRREFATSTLTGADLPPALAEQRRCCLPRRRDARSPETGEVAAFCWGVRFQPDANDTAIYRLEALVPRNWRSGSCASLSLSLASPSASPRRWDQRLQRRDRSRNSAVVTNVARGNIGSDTHAFQQLNPRHHLWRLTG